MVLLLSISIFLSLNIFYKTNSKFININKILYIFFVQIFILNIFFTNGIIGNPNNDIKDFIDQPDVKKIIKNNPIYIIGELDDKNSYLFQFYLPNSKLVKTKQIHKMETMYGLISDKDIIKLKDSIEANFINLKKFKDVNLIQIN